MRVCETQSSMLRAETGLNCYQNLRDVDGEMLLRETASYVYKHPYSVGAMTAAIVGAAGNFVNDSLTTT